MAVSIATLRARFCHPATLIVRAGHSIHIDPAPHKDVVDLPANQELESGQALLLGRSKIKSTVRYFGINVDYAIEIVEQIDIVVSDATPRLADVVGGAQIVADHDCVDVDFWDNFVDVRLSLNRDRLRSLAWAIADGVRGVGFCDETKLCGAIADHLAESVLGPKLK